MIPKILVIGIGPHARTFHIPALLDLQNQGRLRVVGLVDVEANGELLRDWGASHCPGVPLHLIEPFHTIMPAAATARLREVLDATGANAVVISTDPLSHKPYALWAVEHGLHVLLDKPVTASLGTISSIAAALALETDYEEIDAARRAHTPSHAFVLCAHRRFHPGFDFALDLISKVSQSTECPVTSIHAHHSDGQWRFPEEILTQDHHSYHHGHGKLSHSGFHFLDTIYRVRRAGGVNDKEADEVAVTAACIQPDGFLTQVNRADYIRLFGEGYAEHCPHGDEELAREFARFGEMDVEATFEFRRGGLAVGLATASLLHGGFSRRSWLEPGDDLYKGNGRVKHEELRVHVGPFLCLQIHSCQAKDNHAKSGHGDEQPGGNNHFEAWVFRNAGMIGGEPFEKFDFARLPGTSGYRKDALFIDQVKRGALHEFVETIGGRLPESERRSDLSDHRMPVRLMSAAYQSIVAGKTSGNSRVVVPWKER